MTVVRRPIGRRRLTGIPCAGCHGWTSCCRCSCVVRARCDRGVEREDRLRDDDLQIVLLPFAFEGVSRSSHAHADEKCRNSV